MIPILSVTRSAQLPAKSSEVVFSDCGFFAAPLDAMFGDNIRGIGSVIVLSVFRQVPHQLEHTRGKPQQTKSQSE